jgi:hypothetical protein
MVKINLIQKKKTKTIAIPFGWIFVAAYAVVACAGLYLINNKRVEDIEALKVDLENAKAEVKKVKQYTEQKNAKIKERDALVRNKSEYDRILNQTATGGWTPTMLLFEEILTASKTIWLRDLRIEGDGRVQLNGLSKSKLDAPGGAGSGPGGPPPGSGPGGPPGGGGDKKLVVGITEMLEAFKKKETQFKSVRLKRITWEPYRDRTVASFELQCVLNRY